MSGYLMPPPYLGGWTRSMLIELADRRTERRGSKTLDLNSEYLMALQHLIMERRWSWRRKVSMFNMKAGVWQYDLSDTSSSPIYDAQSTWPFLSAQRNNGLIALDFDPTVALPSLNPGQTVYLASATDASLNGPVVITQLPKGNLIINPGFENGLYAWYSAGMEVVNAPVHSGSASMILTNWQQLETGQQFFPITPGQPVTITGWVYISQYAGASPVGISVRTADASYNLVGGYNAFANTATIGSWQSITATFTPAANEVNAYVYISINGQFTPTAQGQVTAYFDDISVTQPVGTSLVVNGGFENALTGWAATGTGIVTSPVHSGAGALQMTGATQITLGQGAVPLTPGVPVTLTGWVYVQQYAGGSPIDVNIATFDSLMNPVTIHSAQANTATIGLWQQVALTFTPAANEVYGGVYLQINSQFSATPQGQVTAYFDDISAVQAGRNFVVNGGFENSLQADGLAGWLPTGVWLQQAVTHSAQWAVEVSGATQVTLGQAAVALTAGVAVTITAWVYISQYAGSCPVDAAVITYDASGNQLNAHVATANHALIGSWQQMTWTFTPTSSEVSAQVVVEINNPYTGGMVPGMVTAYFDDVVALQATGSTNYVVNGGFESGVAGWLPAGFEIEQTYVHSGKLAFGLNTPYPNWTAVHIYPFALTPGVPVEMSAWIYILSYAGTMGVMASIYTTDTAGNLVTYHSAPADVTKIGVWQQVQVTFTPVAKEVTGTLILSINSGSGTPGAIHAFFDDISVTMPLMGTQSGANVSVFATGPQDVMGLNPFPYTTPPNARDLHQFVKHGVHFYPNPGNLTQVAELTPMFERDQQTAAIYANTYMPQPKAPTQYFMMPGGFLILCVSPVPDQNYPIMIDYWACPNISYDSVGEQIPLLPAFMHHVLLKRLEAQIFRYTLGEGTAKYQAAMGEYNALVAQYAGMDGMVPGEHIDYSADDDYESSFANAQSAVQSTT